MSDGTQSAATQNATTSLTSTGATTAQLVVPAAEFALAGLFERVPDARIVLEPAVANPADHALVVVRTIEGDRHAVEAALEADPAVGTVEAFGIRGAGLRYRVTWDDHANQLVKRLVAEDVTLSTARGGSGHWKFRVVAPDRYEIAQAFEALEELGCEPDCRSITAFEGERAEYADLSDEQRNALVAAFEAGYYDVPRAITAAELADELGISHQALSERFRRGIGRMVETSLVFEDEPSD